MANKLIHTNKTVKKPEGFERIETIRGHGAHIWEICWSPDGKILASCSGDWTAKLWDGNSFELVGVLEKQQGPVVSLSWCPEGNKLATGSKDSTLILWDIKTKKALHTINLKKDAPNKPVNTVSWSQNNSLIAFAVNDWRIFIFDEMHHSTKIFSEFDHGNIMCLEWSPDGSFLAIGTDNKIACIWDPHTQKIKYYLLGHYGAVTDISWCRENNIIATASTDETIRLWNPSTGMLVGILEGHTNSVNCVCFSPKGQFLASKSSDETVRLWRVGKWDVTVVLHEPLQIPAGGLAFHPYKHAFATKGSGDHTISIWNFDEESLMRAEIMADYRSYVNARVVLTGDTGVGKSGLSLVMTGKDFRPTESTHSRKVWTFDSWEEILPNGIQETRETLLWDLAGQPGYRLIHQLHLSEVNVALLVFDARSETDPLSGVKHWDRALKQAHRISGTLVPLKKFLVSARCDRGRIPISRNRINSLIESMGFDFYIETSAKEGIGIQDLIGAVRNAIDWDSLPKVSSNILFQSIKQFLFKEKESNRLISTISGLFSSYMTSMKDKSIQKNPKEEFETCIRLVEARGLIRCLSFGNLVLLQPELLDAYASAMIDAAKNEPDGLGCIKESDARIGNFFVPGEIRIKNKEEERLLCIATVEDLLRHELALRQESDGGSFLVFPSQFTRDWEEAPEPRGESVCYQFEGPIYNIYARLSVRLAYSGIFRRLEMWQNACTFASEGSDGTFGIYLKKLHEGSGEIIIFYDSDASRDMRAQFEAYIYTHLSRHALPNSIEKQHIVKCNKCGDPIPPNAIKKRIKRKLDWVSCPTCDNRLSLEVADKMTAIHRAQQVARMDKYADLQRDRATAISIIDGKVETADYDVFLSYNSKDRGAVINIANNLKTLGILPWVDVWELRPGLPWQKALESVIEKVKSAAIIIGDHPLTTAQTVEISHIENDKKLGGRKKQQIIERMTKTFEKQNLSLGPWQDIEVEAFLRQFVKRQCPVIPVILESVKGNPKLPVFLESMSTVDFRTIDQSPFERLLRGVLYYDWIGVYFYGPY